MEGPVTCRKHEPQKRKPKTCGSFWSWVRWQVSRYCFLSSKWILTAGSRKWRLLENVFLWPSGMLWWVSDGMQENHSFSPILFLLIVLSSDWFSTSNLRAIHWVVDPKLPMFLGNLRKCYLLTLCMQRFVHILMKQNWKPQKSSFQRRHFQDPFSRPLWCHECP